MMDTDSIILTAQPEAWVIAVNEIQKIDKKAQPAEILSPEARRVNLPGGYAALMAAFTDNPPIFIRHIFPVRYCGTVRDWSCEEIIPARGDNETFSVQMRAYPTDAGGLNIIRACEDMLTQHGFIRDDKNPMRALSLFLSESILYAGFSSCKHNLSTWNGGAVRYKKGIDFISRAEFKLLEAFDSFGLPPTGYGNTRALDLGAAPGGWSKVLLERGWNVTAVDPAALHESVYAHPKLTAIRDAAQRLKPPVEPYGMIVNDMRMDVMDSARIMLDAADWLAPSGFGVMTLKLSRGQWYKKTKKALDLLGKRYRVKAARQLFHNRDEVTVLLTLPG
jgi:23S rRNA (cytidine2498-2'-O)-methyltransferase